MSERTPIARSLPDKLRIELNHLSMALSRCADQAECDRIMARMREIERTGLCVDYMHIVHCFPYAESVRHEAILRETRDRVNTARPSRARDL